MSGLFSSVQCVHAATDARDRDVTLNADNASSVQDELSRASHLEATDEHEAPQSEPRSRMRPATPRQLEVLRFIALSIRDRGYPPTMREVCAAFGWTSTHGVSDHYRLLSRKGLLSGHLKGEQRARTCLPTASGWAAIGLDPPPPPTARSGARGPHVEVNLGWRCSACNAHTFDASKPCAICAMKKRERAA